MFGKKKCSRCEKKVNKKFEFCPYCGNPLDNRREEYGLLGKTDDVNELDSIFNYGFSSNFGNAFFNKIFGSAMKMLEKEIQKIEKEDFTTKLPKEPKVKTNFELFINGKRVPLPENLAGIQIERIPAYKQTSPKKPIQKKTKLPKISEEILQKSAKLPRKEAKAHLTRTADKVIYELETPGLNKLENIIINKLENSIEIKAFTDKAVFSKTLPIKLPLMQYSINPSEGKLILEFKAQ